LVPELDVHRARTQVESARRDIARFTQTVAQDQNALDLLIGTSMPAVLRPGPLVVAGETQALRPGLSSDVLLRRPDVLQAENLLKAANADIGAARAAFFPRISLTAAFGTASSDLSGLFASGSGAWHYAPQIVMPIFDARTWSAHRAAKTQREMAIAQYERAIQVAFREAADALAALDSTGNQVIAQGSLVQAAEKTYELSNTRFERGLDSYLAVLDAQRSLYAAEQALVSLRLARAASAVQLFAVLGGGVEDENRTEARDSILRANNEFELDDRTLWKRTGTPCVMPYSPSWAAQPSLAARWRKSPVTHRALPLFQPCAALTGA
jgi:multidrug efflux system outer membrane protein